MMKKPLLLLVLCLAIGIAGRSQDIKRVAVVRTFSFDSSISSLQGIIVRNGIESAVSEMKGFAVYGSSMIDSAVIRQGKQDVENIDVANLQTLGQQIGLHYVIFPEAMSDGRICLIISRMLDICSGTFAKSHYEWCYADEFNIQKACSRLVAQFWGSDTETESVVISHDYSKVEQLPSIMTFTIGNVNFDMVKVDAGTFVMGSRERGRDCYDDEIPHHNVTISQPYYIGQYEVTQALYKTVMDTNPSRWQADNLPVERVSWSQAIDFCRKLSQLTGRRFSLPTEAEWEYAAFGGKSHTKTKYCGSQHIGQVAWYNDNSGMQTHPVGSLRPNVLGLYDMSGNVWEWCLDKFGPYEKNHEIDPKGAASGAYRVLRGGGWSSDASNCRATMRYGSTPNTQHDTYGFRLVCH